jgi:hypothetical protein
MRISELMRNSYVSRNPCIPGFQEMIREREEALIISGKKDEVRIEAYKLSPDLAPSATGLTFIGMTGLGKSKAVQMALRLCPHVILHRALALPAHPGTQVVHMTLQCPEDGSILTLCGNFFRELDRLHRRLPTPTRYWWEYMRYRPTIQQVIPSMARIAAEHGLGLLVIDELQNLKGRGSAALLSFLVQLVNTIGVPVVLIGGIEAYNLLREQFRQARRGSEEGDLYINRGEEGREWTALCEELWQFQYTRKRVELNDAFVHQLWDASQGITSYLVGMYKMAQKRAIANESERITPSIIASVARDSFIEARPVLKALRAREAPPSGRVADLYFPPEIEPLPITWADPVEVEPDYGEAADRSSDPARRKPGKKEPKSLTQPITTRRAAPHPTLTTIAREGRLQGKDPYTSFVEAGIIGGDAWLEAAFFPGPSAEARAQALARSPRSDALPMISQS